MQSGTSSPRNGMHATTSAGWLLAAFAIVLLSAGMLRYATNVIHAPPTLDERLMSVPIDEIIERGWTRATMLDYQEVKGPIFYWGYAATAKVIGSDLNDLRLISVLCYILAGLPLLLMAQRCGVQRTGLLVVAALYALLPYHAVISQLMMSEPSFMLLAVILMWVFLWGFGKDQSTEHRWAGPIVFAIVLSLMLHHRPQAVAFAGAVALVALQRDGWRSWRWWAACLVAGLSRLPLWAYWGGLVTSDYQGLFAFGFRVECQTYLFAAVLPMTAIFLWPALTNAPLRRWWWFIALGGLVGLILGTFFSPDMYHRVEYMMPGETEVRSQTVYAGAVRTGLGLLLPAGAMQQIGLAVLSTLGGASLAAMIVVCWNRAIATYEGVVCRLAFWALACGIPLYVITSGPVYDRYLSIWTVLLPIVWYQALPRSALLVQGALLAVILSYLLNEWLM